MKLLKNSRRNAKDDDDDGVGKTKSTLTKAETFNGGWWWVDGVSIYAKGQLFPFAAWSFIKSFGIIKQSEENQLRG